MRFSARRSVEAACCFIAMIAGLPASAQNVGSVVPERLSTLIEHDTEMLSFVCGEPLTAAEKQRFAAAITQQVRQNANYWYKTDAEVSKDLQAIHSYPGTVRAEVWLKWRFNFATSSSEGTRIAAAYDPALVVDQKRQLLITERTLVSLRDAATWMALKAGRPKPDAQYIDRLRSTIKQQWRFWPQDALGNLTGAVKYFPATMEYTVGDLPEAKRKEIFALWAKETGAEPQKTLHMAALMAQYYQLATQELVKRVNLQNITRMGAPSACDMIYSSNPTSTGTGAFCSPWEVNKR